MVFENFGPWSSVLAIRYYYDSDQFYIENSMHLFLYDPILERKAST